MFVLGCDPGVEGALVLIDDRALQVIDFLDMPTVPHASFHMVDGFALSRWLGQISFDVAIIELVGAMPEWGKPACMNFGRLAGGAETLLLTTGRALVHATPVAWKRRAGLLKKPKDASLAVARARLAWPEGTLYLAKHHGRAEAALIALFGRAPPTPPKAPKRSKAVERHAAENVPPGLLFGVR